MLGMRDSMQVLVPPLREMEALVFNQMVRYLWRVLVEVLHPASQGLLHPPLTNGPCMFSSTLSLDSRAWPRCWCNSSLHTKLKLEQHCDCCVAISPVPAKTVFIFVFSYYGLVDKLSHLRF